MIAVNDPGGTVSPITPYADPPKALNEHLSLLGPGPDGLHSSPCTPAALAQRPAYQLLHSCAVVLLDTLLLPTIHSSFLPPECLMVFLNQPAQVSAAPALFVLVTIISPHLTGWGLVARSVLTDASPHVGFSVQLTSLCQYHPPTATAQPPPPPNSPGKDQVLNPNNECVSGLTDQALRAGV